jgi:three-Cys-motif partner protein
MDKQKQDRLFSEEEMAAAVGPAPEPATSVGQNPVWTDNKARFIMLYLKYFVYITKHGTYIDGFAGPQAEEETESWSAKLVLESKPQWFRKFHLCDENRMQIQRLKALKEAHQPKDANGKPIPRWTPENRP